MDLMQDMQNMMKDLSDAQETIESLRAKVAELEDELRIYRKQCENHAISEYDELRAKVAELEAENARLDKGWHEANQRILELQLEAKHEAVEPVAWIVEAYKADGTERETFSEKVWAEVHLNTIDDCRCKMFPVYTHPPKHEATAEQFESHSDVEPVAWIETDGKMTFCKPLLISERTPLYCVPPQPPSTQAAVAAALRKAAEVAEKLEEIYPCDVEVHKHILDLPHDDSHLREFGMRVAREAAQAYWPTPSGKNLQDIVDRVLAGHVAKIPSPD